jgi:hypothetical protein
MKRPHFSSLNCEYRAVGKENPCSITSYRLSSNISREHRQYVLRLFNYSFAIHDVIHSRELWISFTRHKKKSIYYFYKELSGVFITTYSGTYQ